MADMFFHIEQRRAWVRTSTHTIVFDRDPDYLRFARDPSGKVRRMLRIWLAERKSDKPLLRAYLGTVTFCFIRPSYRDMYRLFRFATTAVKPPVSRLKHSGTIWRIYCVCTSMKNMDSVALRDSIRGALILATHVRAVVIDRPGQRFAAGYTLIFPLEKGQARLGRFLQLLRFGIGYRLISFSRFDCQIEKVEE